MQQTENFIYIQNEKKYHVKKDTPISIMFCLRPCIYLSFVMVVEIDLRFEVCNCFSTKVIKNNFVRK